MKNTFVNIWEYYEKYIHKVPYRTLTCSGHKLIHEIMADLQHNYGLNPTRGMRIYEEVEILLITCAHGVGNRLIQEMFNHSGETVHRHFHRVLSVINKLVEDIIKPHPHYNDGVGYHMPQNKKYLPFFKNCIGTIDDTHIQAHLPRVEKPYIGHKGYPIQNVLAIVDFNICFTFVWAEWEGAAHDNRIFGEALCNQNLNFPYPLGHKYYLVDADYRNKIGYLTPYKGENIRYHLEDFRHCKDKTIASTSRKIELAIMAIHNYIRQRSAVDNGFKIA
ncbi:LOW QUALITY PROTEIN: Harbinger transposase-derived nuclease domain [Dillenia turbinata]|uniref:Harbinger transposase-derived nuclease domain n=1 Tax=Dillenia turbinata TaxID=194707 RepID=A0AAN8ZCV4_9MAGN